MPKSPPGRSAGPPRAPWSASTAAMRMAACSGRPPYGRGAAVRQSLDGASSGLGLLAPHDQAIPELADMRDHATRRDAAPVDPHDCLSTGRTP